MGLGIPVITLAVSSFKEVKLLINDKKEITDSISSIVLYVAGTGGGGFVGAKAGAAIGSFGGPAGALIGGAIGGVIGAVTGRWATNSIKTMEFDKAKDQYIYQVKKSKQFIDDFQESQNKSLMNQFQMINVTLNEGKDRLLRRYEAHKLSFDQEVMDCKRKIVEETPNILKGIKEELQQVEKEVLKDLKPNPIRKLLFPSEDDILYDMLADWFAKRYQIIDEAIKKFSVVPTNEEGISERYSEIVNFFATHQANNEDLHELFLRIEREVANFRKLQKEAKSDMFDLVDQAERSLRSKIKEYFAKVYKACEKEKEKINKCKEKLRTEADKLGIDIPGLTE